MRIFGAVTNTNARVSSIKHPYLWLLLSAALLSAGWLGLTGLALPAAFVPLLAMSAAEEPTRRGWWQMCGRAALCFLLWNAATVWWIWYATPVGPIAAALVSTAWSLFAFMLFHTVSKIAPKPLAYTTLVSAWIAAEYWYTAGEVSWPWLVLGNGFSHDVWAVQWYEWTGVFGGSLWGLATALLLYEALATPSRRRTLRAAAAYLLPMALSLVLGARCRRSDDGERVRISILQPNVDCYDKFHGDERAQIRNLFDLLGEVPADVDFILLPETALPGRWWEPALAEHPDGTTLAPLWRQLADTLRAHHPQAMLLTGANTWRLYPTPKGSATTRPYGPLQSVDIYNTAVGIDAAGRTRLHHKGRLVIGVETTPTWIFDLFDFLTIDLGGVAGQLGFGTHGAAFEHEGVAIAPAICYEGLYGDFFGDHVRRGAAVTAILSNDGWWGDTPGYRHLFTISRLRAVEHRRALARSANTGRSGFISPCGAVSQTLGWNRRGVLTEEVAVRRELTFYTRYGDYLGRMAECVLLLSVLYCVAYRVKRRNYLVP